MNPDEILSRQDLLTDCERSMRYHQARARFFDAVYRALLAHCDNQVAIAMNADPGYFVDLRWYHLLLRNLWAFQGTEFLNRNQAAEAG